MEGFPSLISHFLICSFVLIANITFTSADEFVLQGNDGQKLIKFSSVERDIKITCKLDEDEVTNSGTPKWSFIPRGDSLVHETNSSCKGKPSPKNKNHIRTLLSDCDVTFDRNNMQLVLQLYDLHQNEFGDYVCHTGNMSQRNKTLSLKELVNLTRKTKKGKPETSVTVTMDQPLHLFCTQTGLQPEIHKISWLKDGIDITRDLNEHEGIFENFTKTNDLNYDGIALLEHRGNYTCQVDLLKASDDSKYYPRKFSFFVRVKDGNEWKLPVYIIAAEIVVIGLFTAIITWREKKLEDDDNVQIEDSEDEDDVQNSSCKNGTQNNNSNGK